MAHLMMIMIHVFCAMFFFPALVLTIPLHILIAK